MRDRAKATTRQHQSPPAVPYHMFFVPRMLRPAQDGVPQGLGVGVLSRPATAFCRGRHLNIELEFFPGQSKSEYYTFLIHVGLEMMKAVTELTEAAT